MPPKSGPRSGIRRRRGGDKKTTPPPVHEKRRIDRVNDETFGVDESWAGMEWRPEDKLVAEFEEFKIRQRYRHQSTPTPPPLSGDPLARLAGRLNSEDLFRAWSSSSEAIGRTDHHPLFARSQPVSQVTSPMMFTSRPSPHIYPSTAAQDSSMLPPLTKAHRQHVMDYGMGIPPGWLQPGNVQIGENGRTWMTSSELDAVLRTQLNLMERANQALTRPQTIKLSNEQQSSNEPTPPSGGSNSFGRGSYSSARGPREALDVEIGATLAMHSEGEGARQERSPQPPSPESEIKDLQLVCTCGLTRFLGEDSRDCEGRWNNSCLRLNPAAGRALLYELEQALSRLALLKELERRGDQSQPPDPTVLVEFSLLLHSLFAAVTDLPAIPFPERELSLTRSSRRMLLLAAYDKGLRLTAEVWSAFVSPPSLLLRPGPYQPTLDFDSGAQVFLCASFRQCRYITTICKRLSCALYYETFLRLLSHTLAARASLPLTGAGCPVNLLGCLAWDLFSRNRTVDAEEVRTHESHPLLVRIYLLVVITLSRHIQETPPPKLLRWLGQLCRSLLTGYTELIRGRDPDHLENCILVPDDQHEALLATPPMSCLMYIILCGLQLCVFEEPPPCSLADSLSNVARLCGETAEGKLEEGLRKMSDQAIIYVMVSVIGRLMVRQSLRLEGVLTRAIVQPVLAPTSLSVDVNIAGKLNALVPAANCLYGIVGLASKDREIEGVMKKATASNGCSAEGYLMALHSRFQYE